GGRGAGFGAALAIGCAGNRVDGRNTGLASAFAGAALTGDTFARIALAGAAFRDTAFAGAAFAALPLAGLALLGDFAATGVLDGFAGRAIFFLVEDFMVCGTSCASREGSCD